MGRRVELRSGKLVLKDDEIEGFLERRVTRFGNSGKIDVPKRYIGRRAYAIIIKKERKRKNKR